MNKSDLDLLAEQFMLNAVRVQPNDNVWVEYVGPKAKILADACAERVIAANARPFMVDSGSAVINSTVSPLTPEGLEALGNKKLAGMQKMQGYIRIKDDANEEQITLPGSQMALYKKSMESMVDYRVNNTRWLVVAAPTEEFASACNMKLAAFETFYRDVCLADYNAMSVAVQPLKKLMSEGKTIHVYSPEQETDLTLRKDGIPAIPCVGERNIPDGECYTAPVKDSIEGTIKFGPSSYNGQRFQAIKLTFERGQIVKAIAENHERTVKLNEMLDTDQGARYVGEFSINFNPFIKHPTGSILFDEKIDGGIHMAMGKCYDSAPNGNKSAIHWDMVHIQRPEYGGGELYIDGRQIRKDGIFVLPELEPLNPTNLGRPRSQPTANKL